MMYDISVIIATHNRAEGLARTLEGMDALEKNDLSVEFVIVDNASTDQTKSVVESFSDRLAIQYLYESRLGKSSAINCALDNGDLGNIVVFTDDDVDPASNWLLSIAGACSRWPDHSVFGGRIEIEFPDGYIPKWVGNCIIREFAFAYHNYSGRECIYKGGDHPFGPNFWVRKKVFNRDRRFNGCIGPHPRRQTLGDESLFLISLIRDGYEIVYCPEAVVVHRIKREVMTFSGICARGYQLGRASPYVDGLPREILLDKSPKIWRIWVSTAIIWNIFKIVRKGIFSAREGRVVNIVRAIARLASFVEAMRLASNRAVHRSKE